VKRVQRLFFLLLLLLTGRLRELVLLVSRKLLVLLLRLRRLCSLSRFFRQRRL
jgi:hypothetical protein